MPSKRQTGDNTAYLQVLSRAGRGGGRIRKHRSIDKLSFPRRRLLAILLLPPLFNMATWALREPISKLWFGLVAFWLDKLRMPGAVTEKLVGSGLWAYALPHIDLPTRAPDAAVWGISFIVTLIALAGSSRLPPEFLPAAYFLRLVGFIQVTAMAYFAIRPDAFPYSVPEYLDGAFSTGVALMLMVPWLHALVYHVFSFHPARKILLTALSLVFLAIAVPMLALLHALILDAWTVLMLPVLYLIFGLWLQILALIALYGWAMSWPRSDERVG